MLVIIVFCIHKKGTCNQVKSWTLFVCVGKIPLFVNKYNTIMVEPIINITNVVVSLLAQLFFASDALVL